MKSFKGSFLIASPHLEDPNFRRSVVLIMEHNAEGAFGLVLNRPASASVKEFWSELEQERANAEGPIYLGGPVEGPIICIHDVSAWTEGEIVPGVFVAVRRELVRKLVTGIAHTLRLYVGYAGWGPLQLENELEAGGWLTMPASREFIFHDDSAQLWHQSIRATGRQMYRDILGIEWFPEDPTRN